MPKLLIIQPSGYRSKGDHTVIKARGRSVVPLALPYLAALTPPDWKVKLVDELLEEVPLEEPVDVVAITTHTMTSLRAYDLADAFRKRGVKVILGGPHAYFFSPEAAEHADAVGIGEGELIWRQMLEDAASGRLQATYRAEKLSDLKGLPPPRYDLLNLRAYGWLKTFAVQATRGCPFTCDFCSERLYLGGGFRCRPVEEVVDEIKRNRSRWLLFAESNFGGKRDYAMELMQAILPLKIRWSTLWSINLCADREFMDLAQRSGLLHLNLGMESIDPDTISGMHKRQNKVNEYHDILTDMRRRGISYSLNFVFGWDTETREVIPSTLRFLRKHKVPVAYFNILTPDKGTALYERMSAENRILNEADMNRYPGHGCFFKPAFCSPEELVRQIEEAYKEFYGLSSIFKRLPFPTSESDFASWVMNLSLRKAALEESDAVGVN
jgi:radical SAM superfamily enzyme YgiQ (UPF0313 family)